MTRIARLGFALLLLTVAMIPVRSEAAPLICGFQQCLAGADCSGYSCPSGLPASVRCNNQLCHWYCFCLS